MNRRYYDRIKRRKRKKLLGLACVAAISFGLGGAFLFMAVKAMEAPAASVEQKTPAPVASQLTDAGENWDCEEEILVISNDPNVTAGVRTNGVGQETVDGGMENNAVVGEEVAPVTPVVVVDPGHGGVDEGCSREGVLEKEINLGIAKKLQKKLIELGYEVVMTREEDLYVSKEERVELANRIPGDIFVSIHQNADELPTGTSADWQVQEAASGIETWYCGASRSGDSKRLAGLIHQETIKRSGACGRELRGDAQLYVINRTVMPACLIETGFLSSPGERKLLTDGEYQAELAEGIARGIDLYFHPKTMYLTFDDGPSVENTSAILDILKARNIKATFFVVGENVRKHPEVARRIVEEGHTIGIHCYHHSYDEIYQSADSYLKDFEEAYKAVYEVTGVRVKLFRFPGGSINSYNNGVSQEIIDEMTARGFIYFDWNASLEDALKKSEPAELIKNARETTLGRNKVVMLAHDIVYGTALCLDELIDQFPDYRMEALTPDIKPVQFSR